MSYAAFNPRKSIRIKIGTAGWNEEDGEYYYFPIVDNDLVTVEVPIYLSEEVKSESLKEMPYIDMNLALVTLKPHDVGALTRKKEAYIDIGLYYTDTDNIERTDFGVDIIDAIVDGIRTNQCSFTNIDFINVESVRLLKEPKGHQVVYHWVITVYAIYYDLAT